MGAVCNISGYYGIGLPIGVSLMFAAKLGIKGKLKGCFKFQSSLLSSPHSISIQSSCCTLIGCETLCFRSMDRFAHLFGSAGLISGYLPGEDELEDSNRRGEGKKVK